MRCITALLFGVSLGFAQSSDPETATLEQLLTVQVTSASKKVQPLTKVAAAMHVITQEDIRRSGATTIPELLRWVPGLEVARIDSNKWAITARGFNGRTSNKMLVLMDGRSLYGIDFSGVFWDVQDTVLDDVERIEIIRGPGATMWGANAVNGVINIITKHSRDTQGGLLEARAGNHDRGAGQVRYGASIGQSGYLRAFAKHSDWGNLRSENGAPNTSSWRMSRVGFRSDWELGRADKLMVQGEAYANNRGLNVDSLQSTSLDSARGDADGVFVLGRWIHPHRDLSQTVVQSYFEAHRHNDGMVQTNRKVVDVSLQRQQFIGERHDLQWGAGYRSSMLNMLGSIDYQFTPQVLHHTLSAVFVQDEIQLIEGVLSAVLGSEVEHNTYTGMEYQPSARLVWTPTPTATLWAAASRAVRTPSRIDRDVRSTHPIAPGPDGQLMTVQFESSDFAVSEGVRATEIGWRSEWGKRVSTDLAMFYNVYSNLRTIEPTGMTFLPGPPSVLLLQQKSANLGVGEGYGMELSNRFQVAKTWRLTTGYTFLRLDLHPGESTDPRAEVAEVRSPRRRAFVQSSLDLPGRIQLDINVARTGKLDVAPAYTRTDARIGWSASPNLSFSFAGQNLTGPPHIEFNAIEEGLTTLSRVTRTAYGQITWTF
jgi:iron complex outermembrane recepter protein